MHARYILEPAERLASGHADSSSCIACCSERPMGSRPPHPSELGRGLPTIERGGGWAVVRGALQFPDLFQRGVPEPEPVSYMTTGVHSTFELMVRALGRSPASTFFLFCLFSDALGLPQGRLSRFPPPRGNGKLLSFASVRCSPRSGSERRRSWFDYQIGSSTLDITSKSAWKASTPSGRTT